MQSDLCGGVFGDFCFRWKLHPPFRERRPIATHDKYPRSRTCRRRVIKKDLGHRRHLPHPYTDIILAPIIAWGCKGRKYNDWIQDSMFF